MLYCWAMCLNANDWWLAIFFVSLRCSVSVTIGFVPFLESAMPRRFQTKVFRMLEERMLLCVSLRRLSHPLSHTHAHAIAAAPTLSLFARALCGRHMRVYLDEHKARYHLQLQTNWRLWSGCIGFFGFGFLWSLPLVEGVIDASSPSRIRNCWLWWSRHSSKNLRYFLFYYRPSHVFFLIKNKEIKSCTIEGLTTTQPEVQYKNALCFEVLITPQQRSASRNARQANYCEAPQWVQL